MQQELGSLSRGEKFTAHLGALQAQWGGREGKFRPAAPGAPRRPAILTRETTEPPALPVRRRGCAETPEGHLAPSHLRRSHLLLSLGVLLDRCYPVPAPVLLPTK